MMKLKCNLMTQHDDSSVYIASMSKLMRKKEKKYKQ